MNYMNLEKNKEFKKFKTPEQNNSLLCEKIIQKNNEKSQLLQEMNNGKAENISELIEKMNKLILEEDKLLKELLKKSE